MNYKGTVHRYGRDVDTDVIIPARYLNTSDPAELAKHCLEDLDATFVEKVNPGDIIVAEENFGCGSSREHAPIAIKAAGVDAVIAKSFARIHCANLINNGILPLTFENPADYDLFDEGDVIEIDGLSKAFSHGSAILRNVTKGTSAKLVFSFSERQKKMLAAGGLINLTRSRSNG